MFNIYSFIGISTNIFGGYREYYTSESQNKGLIYIIITYSKQVDYFETGYKHRQTNLITEIT